MQTRALVPCLGRRAPRPFVACARGRRLGLVASSSPSPATTLPAAPPSPLPPAPLRQLYPFVSGGEPSSSSSSSSYSNNGRSAPAPPPPLLAGTLPLSPPPPAPNSATAADQPGDDDDDRSHSVYFEVRGNPRGLPALVLHGGPGAGSYPSHARFFDPRRYCVVLMDQRGCGRSAPLGRLRGNTAAALVRDAERLREHLGAPAWAAVLGGSWGAALGLRYALDRPGSVRALVLRAVCTMRPREEVGWLYRGGAGALRPQAWAAFLRHVGMSPESVAAGKEDPLPAYYERLLSEDLAARDAAASAWMAYEWAVYCTRAEDEELLRPPGAAAAAATAAAPLPPPPAPLSPELDARGLRFPGVCAAAPGGGRAPPTRADYTAAQALLLCHYSLHGGFLNGGAGEDKDGSLLSALAAAAREGRLAQTSCAAFHGAADAVCPPQNALELQQTWPQARVWVIQGPVGHSMYDPALVDAVLGATDVAADAADAAAAAGGGAAPLRARRLLQLMEEERRRRDADVAVAAAALARAA